MNIASLLAAVALAAIHLFAGRLRFHRVIPRSRWLSAAGGVSVAYVFVHVLPELSEAQEAVQKSVPLIGFLEHHVYLVALFGLVLFYGLERAVKQVRRRNRDSGSTENANLGIFWLHIFSFALYNGLIGYLVLHRDEHGMGNLLTFAVAMAMHFVVNDFALRQDHQAPYEHAGRWVLAAAVMFGAIVGFVSAVPEAAAAMLFALLAGGVILNTLKEELPEERQSNLWAFVAGTACYASLLMFI